MNSETLPALISDGAGGAIITFLGTNGCRVQRLNSSGVSQWNTTALSSLANNRRPAIVTDGSGGAVVAWAAGNTGIFVQRVTSLGDKLWPPNNTGVQLCTAGNQCAMIPDGAGGATVTWQDFRSTTNYNIYAQRVNGAGATQWLGNGVEVCFFQDDQLAPMIVSDGGPAPSSPGMTTALLPPATTSMSSALMQADIPVDSQWAGAVHRPEQSARSHDRSRWLRRRIRRLAGPS
jgi:hypothetical protein